MMSLHDFKRQPRIHFQGFSFSCEEIIKYTANKLGGVHIDFRRDGDERLAKLDQAAAYMKFGGPLSDDEPQPSELYFVLEPKGSQVLSGVHIEIIAAAASLIQVQFDGQPVVQVTRTKTIWSTLKGRLTSKPLPDLLDQGKKLDAEIRRLEKK